MDLTKPNRAGLCVPAHWRKLYDLSPQTNGHAPSAMRPQAEEAQAIGWMDES